VTLDLGLPHQHGEALALRLGLLARAGLGVLQAEVDLPFEVGDLRAAVDAVAARR